MYCIKRSRAPYNPLAAAPPAPRPLRPVQAKPAVKLKPFFWNKLPAHSLSTTIWADADNGDLQLDLKDLEQAFAAQPPKIAKASAGEVQKKPQVTTLLRQSRAQNVGAPALSSALSFRNVYRTAQTSCSLASVCLIRLFATPSCTSTILDFRSKTFVRSNRMRRRPKRRKRYEDIRATLRRYRRAINTFELSSTFLD